MTKVLQDKLSLLEDEEEKTRTGLQNVSKSFEIRLQEIESEKKGVVEQIKEKRSALIKKHISVLLELVPEHVHSNRQHPCSDENCCNESSSAKEGYPCPRCRLIVIRDEDWRSDVYDIEIEVCEQ